MHRPRFIIDYPASAPFGGERSADRGADQDPTRPTLGSCFTLSDAHSHHLANVLRRGPGDELELFFSKDQSLYLAAVDRLENGLATVCLTEALELPEHAAVHLLVGMPKQKASEFIIQRCVEAGVRSIHFFHAAHSPFKIPEQSRAATLSRWGKIRDQALQQARASTTCSLALHASFQATLELLHGNVLTSNSQPSSLKLLLVGPGESSASSSQPLKITEVLSGHPLTKPASPKGLENLTGTAEIYLAVGPEGGFGLDERSQAQGFEYLEASLGSSVFRTETAALVVASIIPLFR